MIQRAIVSTIVVMACAGVWASEPGQPLDCSDWVADQPGFECQAFAWCPAATTPSDEMWVCSLGGEDRSKAPSNEGALLWVRYYQGIYGNGIEIVQQMGQQLTLLGHIASRDTDRIYASDWSSHERIVRFDTLHGRLYVSLLSESGSSVRWIAAISGFAPLYDIQQTYSPATPITFHVPAMPEGMLAVDFFDTYWGDLATVGDWSQAQGLQCQYPAEVPAVGDYLTVADTLPTPDPGHGYYYVTAATYQGQTRYGRKTIDGVLSGRDPALLPACSQD